MNKKIIYTCVCMLLILMIYTNVIFAATIGTSSIKNNKDLGQADTDMQNIGSKIFTAVSNVGVAVSVVVIAFIGVKYMIGSVDERAEYKKTMIPYLIGALLVFSASAIGKVVYTIFSKI